MAVSSYHHGNLREALVVAAVEAARASGPDGVALRELARTVGVSHSAAYRHFSHRDELVAEVAARAMGELVAAMEKRLDLVEQAGAVDPVDPVLRARRRLIAIGEGYVAFALAEPGLFRSAFAASPLPGVPVGVPASVDDDGAGAAVADGGDRADPAADLDSDPYGLLTEALDELAEVGYLSAAARVGAEMTCWSAVHGFSLLHLEGPLGTGDAAARQEALDQVLVAIDRSYAASSGTAIEPDDDIFTRRGR
jgi:AcrR family transcriptional regulator